jgi:hypothetical protein
MEVAWRQEAIWIEKDGVEIRFDIIIPMPKGALSLYCMYYKRQTEVDMRQGRRESDVSFGSKRQDECHEGARLTRTLQRQLGPVRGEVNDWGRIGSSMAMRGMCESESQKEKNARESERERNVHMIEHRERKKVPMSEHKAQKRAREKKVPIREHKAAAKRKNRIATRGKEL